MQQSLPDQAPPLFEDTLFGCRYVKDADKAIIKHIKEAGRLVDNQTFVHSYPFCWRSDTPLIYRVRGVLCCLPVGMTVARIATVRAPLALVRTLETRPFIE